SLRFWAGKALPMVLEERAKQPSDDPVCVVILRLGRKLSQSRYDVVAEIHFDAHFSTHLSVGVLGDRGEGTCLSGCRCAVERSIDLVGDETGQEMVLRSYRLR